MITTTAALERLAQTMTNRGSKHEAQTLSR
jgi:hypothetical protein